MRISYLLNDFGYTGGSLVLYCFMDHLLRQGHEVFAVTPTRRIQWRCGLSQRFARRRVGVASQVERFFRHVDKHAPRPLVQLGRGVLGKPPKEPQEQLAWITQGLRKHWLPSDVTIATHFSTIYAAYLYARTSCVLYHCQHFEELTATDPVMAAIARLSYHVPVPLILNSTWLKSIVSERIGRDGDLLTPGIDTGMYFPRVPLDRKYSQCDKTQILAYCDHRPFKGWSDVERALSLLPKRFPHRTLRYLVFGQRPPISTLPLQYMGRIFGADLADLYSSSNIFVGASWFESFPLPPLEAMACGTAVVTTPAGTEDYVRDGLNAVLVPPQDAEALADAISTLIEDPDLCHQLAGAGVDTAKQHPWSDSFVALDTILANRAPTLNP